MDRNKLSCADFIILGIAAVGIGALYYLLMTEASREIVFKVIALALVLITCVVITAWLTDMKFHLGLTALRIAIMLPGCCCILTITSGIVWGDPRFSAEPTYETTWTDDVHSSALAQDGLLQVGSMSMSFSYSWFELTVEVPGGYADRGVSSFEAVVPPIVPANVFVRTSENTANAGRCRFSYFPRRILVYPIIDAELTSRDFYIPDSIFDSQEVLDVTKPGSQVTWMWHLEKHILGTYEGLVSLSIFLNEIPDPAWSCTFLLQVSE